MWRGDKDFSPACSVVLVRACAVLIQMEQGREELKTFRLPRVESGPGDPEKPEQNESSSLSESKAAAPSTGAAKHKILGSLPVRMSPWV